MNKQRIALLVDSGLDVPKKYIEKYNMYLLPLKIIYSNEEYLDGVEISADEVYSRLETEIPKTSLPSGEHINNTLNQIKADGYEKVLAITISSGLSGTYNAISLFGSQFEGLEVQVIDTKNIAIGSGFHAIQAGKLIDSGMKLDEIVSKLNNNIKNSKVFFCVSTLEYLKKGGRIGLVKSLLGTAFDLKPIISCNDDGIYYIVSKVRGRKNSIKKAMELAKEFVVDCSEYNFAIYNGNALEEANQIKKVLLPEMKGCVEFIEGQISPALGVHTGPGLIGLGIYKLI